MFASELNSELRIERERGSEGGGRERKRERERGERKVDNMFRFRAHRGFRPVLLRRETAEARPN